MARCMAKTATDVKKKMIFTIDVGNEFYLSLVCESGFLVYLLHKE